MFFFCLVLFGRLEDFNRFDNFDNSSFFFIIKKQFWLLKICSPHYIFVVDFLYLMWIPM